MGLFTFWKHCLAISYCSLSFLVYRREQKGKKEARKDKDKKADSEEQDKSREEENDDDDERMEEEEQNDEEEVDNWARWWDVRRGRGLFRGI